MANRSSTLLAAAAVLTCGSAALAEPDTDSTGLAPADVEERYSAEFVEPVSDFEALALQPRTLLLLHLGFGGQAERETEVEGGPVVTESDLLVTYGASARLELPVHLYAGLGLFAQYSFWLTEQDDDGGYGRSDLIDLGGLAKIRFPFAGQDRAHAEIYVAVPVGLSVSMISSDVMYGLEERFPGLTCELGTGTGLMVGVLGGVQYYFGMVGLVGEVGWLSHSSSHELKISGAADTVTTDYDVSMSQIALNVGAAFLL